MQPAFLGCFTLTQTGRTFDVVIVQKLIGIRLQLFIFNYLVNGSHRFRMLLQIIIIDSRDDMKLRTSVVQPHAFVPIRKKFTIFRYPLHTAQGTVPIVIKLFIQSGALINLHQTDIGNKKFQLIFSYVINVYIKFLCPLKIHAHKGAET